jgi:hypothetical protein
MNSVGIALAVSFGVAIGVPGMLLLVQYHQGRRVNWWAMLSTPAILAAAAVSLWLLTSQRYPSDGVFAALGLGLALACTLGTVRSWV